MVLRISLLQQSNRHKAETWHLHHPPGAIYNLIAFSPDSRFLASSLDDGTVVIWSLTTFEHVATFEAHPGLISHWTRPIEGLDWFRTGFIATGGAGSFEFDPLLDDYSIKIWKVEEVEGE